MDYSLPAGVVAKNPPKCRRHKRYRSKPWVGKIPWCKKWQTISVFLSGKSHGAWEGYSPWCHTESDITELLSMHAQIMNRAGGDWDGEERTTAVAGCLCKSGPGKRKRKCQCTSCSDLLMAILLGLNWSGYAPYNTNQIVKRSEAYRIPNKIKIMHVEFSDSFVHPFHW